MMDEPANLWTLLSPGTEGLTLEGHLKKNRHSLLNRYYGIYRVEFYGMKTYILVMQDATYGEG